MRFTKQVKSPSESKFAMRENIELMITELIQRFQHYAIMRNNAFNRVRYSRVEMNDKIVQVR